MPEGFESDECRRDVKGFSIHMNYVWERRSVGLASTGPLLRRDEFRRLPHKFSRILEEHFINNVLRMPT